MSQRSQDLAALGRLNKCYNIPFDIDHNVPEVPWTDAWMHACDGIIASINKHVHGAQLTFDKRVKDNFPTAQSFKIYKDKIVDELGVKLPMDFPTVRDKLRQRRYCKPIEYHLDMQRIWANCCRFNGRQAQGGRDSSYYHIGVAAREHYMAKWKKVLAAMQGTNQLDRPLLEQRNPVPKISIKKPVRQDQSSSITGLSAAQLAAHASSTGQQLPPAPSRPVVTKVKIKTNPPPQPAASSQPPLQQPAASSQPPPQQGIKRPAPTTEQTSAPSKVKIKIKSAGDGSAPGKMKISFKKPSQ